MDTLFKYCSGVAVSVMSFFAPIKGLVICAVIFVAIDFVTGIAASYKRARSNGTQWGFESAKAWNTVTKLSFVMAGIALAWLLDIYILSFMNMRLTNLFTGFVCGVEFWSYLENAAEISGHPVFRGLKKIMKKKFDNAIGDNDEQRTKE